MIERQIIIGCIVSTEFLQQIQDIWHPELLESSTARQISTWCWEYFEQYSTAPGREIENIFYNHKLSKLSKDIATEIEEDILPSLSVEYEREGFNVEFLVDETKRYLNKRDIVIKLQNALNLTEADRTEEAQKIILDYKPLTALSTELRDYILSVSQIRKHQREKPIMLMKPWLRQGQATIVYGTYGVGKTLLSILIAYLLGLEDFTEYEIGEWIVKHPIGTLYIDGEVGELEMEERISQFEWMGAQQGQYRMRVLSIPEYQLATEDSFYLSDRANQLKVENWLKEHPTYGLVILDSASTLFGLENENDNSEWNNKVNPFLRDLRAMGVSCILLHHAGKDSKKGLRGASAMGAMTHNIFRLVNHEEKNIDDGEAWFVLSKDKQRAAGFSFKTFSLKFTQRDNQMETHWHVPDK